MKKLLIAFLMLFCVSAYANVLDTCVQKIAKNDELWQQRLFDKNDGIFKSLGDQEQLTDEIVQKNKSKIYTLLAGNVLLQCAGDLVNILNLNQGIIQFKHDTHNYAFQFNTEEMINYMGVRTGILVMNRRDLTQGEVLELSSIPRKQKFFSDECSDWTIADNLDDDAAVNIAGQAVFNEYGGSKNEFFLDFADGDNRRAFPGLVLMDKTGSTAEQIVTYPNINAGKAKTEQFAKQLKNTACSLKGDLAVYLVALDVQRDTSSEKRGWMIGASIGGGAMAWIGISTGLASISFLSSVGWIASMGSAASATAAAITAATGPVGWIVAGVAIAGATAIALYPSKIEDLKQVMILDGPYKI